MSHGWVKKQLYVTSDSALCRSGIGEKATLCHHQSEPLHAGRWYTIKKIQIHFFYICMGYEITPLVTKWKAMISSITAAACTLFLVPFVPSHGTSGQTGQEK